MSKLTPEQQSQADVMAEAMRQAFNPGVNDRLQLGVRQPPQPEQRVPCVSPSGAHFVAVVVVSRTFPQGRVVKLDDYEYPPHPELLTHNYRCHDGPERFEFPRNMTIVFGAGERKGDMTTDAKTFLTQTTFLRDLREYVGKGLDPMIRADRQAEIAKWRAKQQQEHDAFVRATEQQMSSGEGKEPAKP